MKFSVSFCDPLSPEILELGDLEEEKVVEVFESIPWRDYLVETNPMDDPDVHYAPSLEVENKKLNIGLELSAIDENEWHLFLRKSIDSNAPESIENELMNELTGQSETDAIACLNAFLNVDLDYLERTFAQ
jgi:hypothetical protein